MSKLVSVIVPVYNVEHYLRECVDSILRQKYKGYEVILVDDGSTDNSGIICDEYAENNPQVSVIHQDNQGLSGARNSGVRIAKGEYVTFVDSDDIVSDDYIGLLVGSIRNNCDVTVTGMRKFTYDVPNNSAEMAKREVLTNEEALKILCNQTKFGNSACAKLYKKYLVDKYPYPQGKLYEDLATTYKIMAEAKGIVYCYKTGYFYRQRSGSIRKIDSHGIEYRDWYILDAAHDQYEFINNYFPGASASAKGRCVVAGFELLKMIAYGTKEDKENFKRIKQYIKPLYKEVLISRDVNKKTKIKCLSICLGYYPAISCSLLFDFMRKMIRK